MIHYSDSCVSFILPPPFPLLLLFCPSSLLQEKRVNLSHIESRMSRRVVNEVEIFADCSCSKKEFNELLQHLKDHVNIISFNTPAHVWSAEAGVNTCAPHEVFVCVCVSEVLPERAETNYCNTIRSNNVT